jgi:hypothetical protein
MRVVLLLTLLLGLTAPAPAADDIATAQGVISSQAEAFGRDDAKAAYSYAAPAIREMFPQADIFMFMVQNSYAPVYRHKSFEFGEARLAGDKVAQRVHIVDANGLGSALYAGAAGRRQPEDRRLRAAQGRAGGLTRAHSRRKTRIRLRRIGAGAEQ